MRTIEVKFIATPEQERAFRYLFDRGLEDGLETIAGVTEAHELTIELLQKYLNYVADDPENDDNFVHGFDYGFDFGVAMTLLEGSK